MRWRFSASALLAGAACAQSDPVPSAPPTQALPHVEVTGSNIKQAEIEGASPVQVITRDEIRRSGAATLRELFDIVSTVGGAQRDTGGRGTFSAGSSAASLRDLGSKSTLVLLNSRRVAPYPLAEYSEIFVNIDALPMEAIERVDILRSGASAIYGSEAVAGVINIITRTDYQALPEAVVHGDLFRDNALFTSNGLSGVIDFHHSARHKRLFDVATAINDWCTTLDNQLDDARTLALLSGYQSITPLTLMERLLLPGVLTYSALTFVLSRLQVDAAKSAADSVRDRKLPNKSALPMLLKLHQHLRAPWLGRAA